MSNEFPPFNMIFLLSTSIKDYTMEAISRWQSIFYTTWKIQNYVKIILVRLPSFPSCLLHRFFSAFVIFKPVVATTTASSLFTYASHHTFVLKQFFLFPFIVYRKRRARRKMFKLTRMNSDAVLLASILVIVITPSTCVSTMLLDPLSPGEFYSAYVCHWLREMCVQSI